MHKNFSGVTVDINDANVMIYMKLFTLLYADDTVLMAEIPTDLQNCLDSFASYCSKWKLNVNIGKTKIVIFGVRKLPNLQGVVGWCEGAG